jgi:hypothetical protein
VTIRDGTVVDVRRRPQAAADIDRTDIRTTSSPSSGRRPVGATSDTSAGAPVAADSKPVDLAAIARGAATLVDAPLDSMLLDAALHRRFARARRQRWLLSIAGLLAAVVTLAWAADRRRDRQLGEVNARIERLTVAAEPALRAAERLQRARAESGELTARGASSGIVLERLGALLPRDAFIQRLEWDGAVWRIDGSALDAPRIVPLLDASPAFDDVRIVAASTRFLDAGRQRESFSISFRARPTEAPGGQ